MKILRNIVFVGASTALGAITGLISNPQNPNKSGLVGAAIGMAAGALISALICKGLCDDSSINYYGKSSGLYEGYDESAII